MNDRRGFTVVEALTALLLLAIVLGIGWDLAARMGAGAAELADRSESLAASRATAWILQEELAGVRAADLSPPAADSLSIRAFRGVAVVCGAAAPAELRVRWSGWRAPDPTKDSVLVLGADGGWTVRALSARAGDVGACAGRADGDGGTPERWTLDRPAAGALLLRFFERGSYHLSDDAFRYRIGGGGRQPLTPANLDPAGTALRSAAPGRVLLELSTRGVHLGRRGAEVTRTFALPGRW